MSFSLMKIIPRVPRIGSIWKCAGKGQQFCSSALDTVESQVLHGFTSKQPQEHTEKQVGLWYKIPEEKVNQLFNYTGIPRFYQPVLKGFNETKLLIRKPAVTIIDYIRRANYDMAPNKYILYGEHGNGKSLTMMHLAHFLHEEKFIMFFLYCPTKIMRDPIEVVRSTQEGFYDHTSDAALILQMFADQNAEYVEDLKTTEEYIWNKRESTAAGSPILELVEFGINRIRYASEVLTYLIREMKKAATEKKCRVALVFDGINILFTEEASFRRKALMPKVSPQNFTLFKAYQQFFKNDWTNGCIVGGLEARCNHHTRREHITPRYLLRQTGWEALNPFLPVGVEKYTPEEFNQVYDYYLDRRWFQHPASATDRGRNEIEFLSGKHPLSLLNISISR